MLPVAKSVNEGKSAWYPPGHGDLYTSLHRSGVLDRLLAEGKEYLFISDSDNLGAVSVLSIKCFSFLDKHWFHISVDQVILQHMIETESEFIMEVTHKTKLDVMVRSCVPPNFMFLANIDSIDWDCGRWVWGTIESDVIYTLNAKCRAWWPTSVPWPCASPGRVHGRV